MISPITWTIVDCSLTTIVDTSESFLLMGNCTQNRASPVEAVWWVIRTLENSQDSYVCLNSYITLIARETGNQFLQLLCWFSFPISWKGNQKWLNDLTLSLEYVHALLAFFGVFGKAANLTCNQVFPFEKDVIMQKQPAWFPGQWCCSCPDVANHLPTYHRLPLSLIRAAVSCKRSSWPLQPFPGEHIWTGQFLFEFSQEFLFLFQKPKAANIYPPFSSSAF